MKIKLKDIAQVQNSLINLVQMKIPATVAWKFSRVTKQINDEFTGFNTAREQLFKKYGQPKGEGPSMTLEILPENVDIFRKEINDLLEEDIDINFEPVSVSILGAAEISIADITNLSMFFIDKEGT